MQKAAFLDIDGTLYKGFITINFIYHLAKQGFVSEDFITMFDHLISRDKRRFTSYEMWADDVTSKINKVFVGHDRKTLNNYLNKFKKEMEMNLYSYTSPLIELLHGRNFEIILITGAHDFIAESFSKIFEFSFTDVLATKMAEDQGKFIDQFMPGFYLNSKDKKRLVIQLSKKYDLTKSIAIGDSDSDLGMFEIVGRAFLVMDNKTNTVLKDAVKKLGGILINKEQQTEQILKDVRSSLP